MPEDTTVTQWLAPLLKAAPVIESSSANEVVDFFVRWAETHTSRTQDAWAQLYLDQVQPVFLRTAEWRKDIVQQDDAEDVKVLWNSQKVMVAAVRNGRLGEGLPPEQFLPEKQWYEAICQATDDEEVKRLRDSWLRMHDDIADRKLRVVTDRRDYLLYQPWKRLIMQYGEESVDRGEELFCEMENQVLAGGFPYSPADFLLEESCIAAQREAKGAFAITIMGKLQEKMIEDVLLRHYRPSGPADVFKVDQWNAAMEVAKSENELQLTRQLFAACRAKVLESERALLMQHPARAKFEHEFADEEELILPITDSPANLHETLWLPKLKTHIRVKRRLRADVAWIDAIAAAKSPEVKETMMNLWPEMTRNFLAGGDLYRPQNIPPVPPDLAAQALELGFPDKLAGREGTWQYQKVLGQGSFGVATLWVRLDSHARGIDREVAKDTYLSGSSWDEPTSWTDDLEARVPLQWDVVRKMRAVPESHNVIDYHTYGIYEDMQMHRIYMEYGGYGTLGDLVDRYRRFAENGLRDTTSKLLPCNIPAGLAWCIFSQLTLALHIAQKGCLPRQTLSKPALPHDSILHRDIRPVNIFLSSSNTPRSSDPRIQQSWPRLPTFKLADWALCTLLSRTSTLASACGTAGCKAPEQYYYTDAEREALARHHNTTTRDRNLGAQGDEIPAHIPPAADLFSRGRVMLALLNVETGDEVADVKVTSMAPLGLLRRRRRRRMKMLCGTWPTSGSIHTPMGLCWG